MREAERCFPALLAPRKLFLPKRNYCQLQAVDFCLACLGFCSGSVAFLALTRTLATATTDGYYYFSKFAVFLVSLHGSREMGVEESGQQLLCNWSSVATLLAGNLNYLCRSDHGYGSSSSTSCEFQPLHMLCSPTVLAGNGQEALIFINFLATKCTSSSAVGVRVCQVYISCMCVSLCGCSVVIAAIRRLLGLCLC